MVLNALDDETKMRNSDDLVEPNTPEKSVQEDGRFSSPMSNTI